MTAPSIYSRVLVKAAELLGGRARLCRQLQVPEDMLEAWIEDKATPPLPAFLKAVDIVMDELDVDGAGPGDPPPSQDCSSAEAMTRF